MRVEVACQKPDEIPVTITASATLGEWREIAKRLRGSQVCQYYGPLDDLVCGIQRAVTSMYSREAMPENERESGSVMAGG